MASVGYGDINPLNTSEYSLVIILMIVSSGIYAYIID